MEVTYQETRAHLGLETQRQWSDPAIDRTTPILLGLFSWTTLAANLLRLTEPLTHRAGAWYPRQAPTFADAIALVRRQLWHATPGFSKSRPAGERREIPPSTHERLVDAVAYAA